MLPKLDHIILTNGQRIDFADDVTAIVGPNNAGKSRLLREVVDYVNSSPAPRGLSVEGVKLTWPGTPDSLMDWLGIEFGWRPPGQYPQGFTSERSLLAPNGQMIHESSARSNWGMDNIPHLSSLYAINLDAQNRLGVQVDGGAFNRRQQPPSSPAQHLYDSRPLTATMSDLMKRAFGTGLTVDRYAGSEIHMLVGEVLATESQPPPSEEYLNELTALPRLAEQGDGMRAFMGMLLTIYTAKHRLILIDEPEAFLHPPQARLLGRILGEYSSKGTQIVVATHSEDVVQGLTSAASSQERDPTIVRLRRNQTTFAASQIPVEKVQDLYRDPLLRYSRVLSGLFYQGVVVCEGDSDCTYYQAVLDHLISTGDTEGIRDIHLVHCGGKARIPRAIDALQAASVPVAAIVDFDILKSDNDLAKLMSAKGGDISALTSDLNIMRSAITSRDRPPNRAAVRSSVLRILDSKNADALSNSEKSKISEALSASSGWDDTKKSGSRTLSGEALQAHSRIDTQLRNIGIFVVPEGELESFHREIPSGDKAAWLASVLDNETYKIDGPAHNFVKSVVGSLSAAMLG